jgi:hypothetical protein
MPELGPQPTEADPSRAAQPDPSRAAGAESRVAGADRSAVAGADQSRGPGPESRLAGADPSRVAAAESWSQGAGADLGSEDLGADAGDRDVEPLGLSVVGGEDSQDPPRPPSRTRRIVLTSVLAVGLIAIAVLGWAGWQISSQKNATMTTPTRIAGLHLDDSQSGRDTADYLQNALSAEVDLDKAVGAVYTDSSHHDVLFFGGTTLIWSPGSDLKTAFGLISDDQGAVTNLHDVPAGRYGGTMRCGTTQTADGAMPVCGWADHGSLALAMFPNRTETESANLLLQIRDATQKRN